MLNDKTNEEFMVKVVAADDVHEVYEIPSNTPARAVDSMHYSDTKKVKYIGAYENTRFTSPVRVFAPFTYVELETGHEDVAGAKTVVCVKPAEHNRHL